MMSIFVVPLLLATFHFQLQSNQVFACSPVLDEGPCKERCEKNRGGGPYSFKLNCESTYISAEEKNQCMNDCNIKCPAKLCLGGKTILCKAQNEEAAKLEREKEEEKNRTRLEREKELKDLMDTIDSKKTLIFALVMMIIFASFASICGVIVACRVFDVDGDQYERTDKHTSALGRLFHRRKKMGRVVPYVPIVQGETHASGHEVGIGPIIIE